MGGRRLDHDRLRGDLLRRLRSQGLTAARVAREGLQVSQPSFSRLLAGLHDDVLVVGRGRATRYAARRTIPGVGASLPVYEVLEGGTSRMLGRLQAVWPPPTFVFETACEDAESGVFDDLPWFLADLRPSGFLGRLVPRRHPDLDLPPDVTAWSSEHCLRFLTRHGWDSSGSLIVGDEAFRLFLRHATDPGAPVGQDDREAAYEELAADVLTYGAPGSSAAGEHPKLLATRAGPGPEAVPVLVKFSPPIRTEVGRRVSDLLVCEHVAHGVLEEHGQPAARSAVLFGGERCFLEVERFDRAGLLGRRGLISLASLDAEFAGVMQGWGASTRALCRRGVVGPEAARRARWLELFGHLIGNSDMHHGNLSFFARGTRIHELAPAYDMTPMLYAPRDNHVVDPPLSPPPPDPSDADDWEEALDAARRFWADVASHPDVSPAFREIASRNGGTLRDLAQVGRLLPR